MQFGMPYGMMDGYGMGYGKVILNKSGGKIWIRRLWL